MSQVSFDKVLIANRGEIARRVLRTCRAMGYRTVAVYSEADRASQVVREADEAVCIGPPPATESYLAIDRLIAAAKRTGAGAIHPGYGFLAENAAFAAACEAAGIVFIGPTAASIAAMGSKIEAKALMRAHGVPVIPGYDGADQDPAVLAAEARKIGFPVLLKASAGGGGKGMRIVREAGALDAALAAARREAHSAFADGTLLLERYIDRPRHVEFQILGDGAGTVLHLFERECSIQRRHQKIIEETPSVALDAALRQRMAAAAVTAGEAIDYRSAGTVEFILAPDGAFYFLEVNTRLQVEHPVTEETTGLDLVRLQLLVAAGEPLPITQADIRPCGHSLECRIYAEDPAKDFLPATGRLADWHFEDLPGLRVDAGVAPGDEVSIYYDPMLAKVITRADTRAEATRLMIRALDGASIQGVTTNRELLVAVLRHPEWASGAIDTHFIDRHFPDPAARHAAPSPEVVARAALAATVVVATGRQRGRALLPAVASGWRNNRWRDTEDAWLVAGAAVTVLHHVAGDALSMRLGEDGPPRSVRVLARADVAPGVVALTLEIDDHVAAFRVASDGPRVHVHAGGVSLTLTAAARFPDEAAEDAAGGCVAPMPGKVLQVLVAAGDVVTAGQPLVVLEAMKMEHTLSAPAPGTVVEVYVAVGQLVDAAATLVLLAEPE